MPPGPNELSQESESQWNEGWGIPCKNLLGSGHFCTTSGTTWVGHRRDQGEWSKGTGLKQATTLQDKHGRPRGGTEGPGLTRPKSSDIRKSLQKGDVCAEVWKMSLNVPGRQGQRASWWRRQLGRGIRRRVSGWWADQEKAGRSAEVTHGRFWIPEQQKLQEGCKSRCQLWMKTHFTIHQVDQKTQQEWGPWGAFTGAERPRASTKEGSWSDASFEVKLKRHLRTLAAANLLNKSYYLQSSTKSINDQNSSGPVM